MGIWKETSINILEISYFTQPTLSFLGNIEWVPKKMKIVVREKKWDFTLKRQNDMDAKLILLFIITMMLTGKFTSIMKISEK